MKNDFPDLTGISLKTDPSIPVKGIQISLDPSDQPGYIYVDSAENISKLFDDAESAPQRPLFSASPFQQIITEAFLRDPEDLYSLDQKLSSLAGMKQFKCGIVVRALTEDGKPYAGPDSFAENAMEDLRRFFPRSFMAVVKDSVYILISSDEMIGDLLESIPAGFEDYLKSRNAFAMTGNSSQWLKGLKVLFYQCYRTLPIAAAVRFGSTAGKHVLSYNRFAFYYTIHLAELSAGRDMGSSDILYLCDNAVLTLTRYDRSFNSDLRDTLFVYLMNDRNISATSRQLHVHRNTVIYKLGQIKSLIGDKTEDPYIRHSLISSCMIIRYIEEYHKQEVDLPPVEKALLKKNI